MSTLSDSEKRASIAVVLSAFLWGTWWIPLRHLSEQKSGGAGVMVIGFCLPFLLLLPWAVRRFRKICRSGWPVWLGAFFVASAITLYAEGVLRGQVARVILLFYLTPVWSSLLGRLMLNEIIDTNRVIAIFLGLLGMAVVVGFENGLPLPQNLYEWLALLSGFCWALGMVYTRRTAAVPVIERVIPQTVFIGILFFLLSLLPGGATLTLPSLAVLNEALGWLLAFAFFWTLPVIGLAIYGGSFVNPGRVAILLLLEPVIGLLSAALLADEPFGWREMIGALLVISAGLAEMLPNRRRVNYHSQQG